MLPGTCCTRRFVASVVLISTCCLLIGQGALRGADEVKAKPSPDDVLKMLKAGNERFVAGKAEHPHADAARLQLAGSASQADHAYATVLSCSDSRVPVERIFDAGVMDLFVVRVAGNVCNTDEIGSIEYGLAHVRTPLLVILGHTQCGAVTAVTQHLQGHGHALERNIPPLIKSIEPAVKQAMRDNAGLTGPELVAKGIEANVWTGIENLFRTSPAVRDLASKGAVKVVGAVYDVGTGRINWLSENTVHRLLGRVEMDPYRATEAMASSEGTAAHGDTHAAPHGGPNVEPTHQAPPAGHEVPKPPPVTKPLETKPTHAAPIGEKEHGETIIAPAQRTPSAGHEPQHKVAEQDHASATTGKPANGDAHGEQKAGEPAAAGVEMPPAPGRPWGLIGLCGVVFILGLGVALAAHFMRDKHEGKAPAAAAPAAPAAKAPDKAPTQTAPEAGKAPAPAPAAKA